MPLVSLNGSTDPTRGVFARLVDRRGSQTTLWVSGSGMGGEVDSNRCRPPVDWVAKRTTEGATRVSRPHPVIRRLVAGQPVDPNTVDDAVVASAVEHRVDPFLRRTLVEAGGVQRSALFQLEAVDMSWRHRRAKILAVAARIHQELSEAGIDHVFFKGVAEASRLYPDPSMRKFVDIDLILRPGRRLSEAVSVLKPEHPHLAEIRKLDTSGYLPTVDLFVEGVSVDIHLDPFRIGPTPRDPISWWNHTVTSEIDGIGRALSLSDPLAFAAFVLHQGRDRFRYLLGAVEFGAWMDRGVDWEAIRELVTPEGTWDELLAAAEVLDSIEGRGRGVPPVNGWRRRAWHRLWNPEVILAGPAGRGRQGRRGVWMMPLLSRRRFWRTAAWILRSAIPPAPLLAIRHPQTSGSYLKRLFLARLSILRAWRHRHAPVEVDFPASRSSPDTSGVRSR